VAIDLERERAALDWYEGRRDEFLATLEHARNEENDAQVLELATEFAPFLAKRSYWDEGESVARWALDAAYRQGDANVAARMLNELGTIHRLQARFEEAALEFTQALEGFRSIGDPSGEAWALSNLGLTLRKLGDSGGAREAFATAVDLWRKADDREEQRFGLARSLNNLGMALRDEEDFEGARELFEEALAIRHKIGDADGVSRTLNNLGRVAILEEDPQRAAALHTQALEIRRAIGDEHGVARTAGQLALALAGLERLDEADALLEEAMAIRHQLGDRYGEAQTAEQMSQLEDARRRAGE
jgi:tetratricopeptide (TPR) repeat protein